MKVAPAFGRRSIPTRCVAPPSNISYIRYHLMVAYLEEKKGIEAGALLQTAARRDAVERELHALDAW